MIFPALFAIKSYKLLSLSVFQEVIYMLLSHDLTLLERIPFNVQAADNKAGRNCPEKKGGPSLQEEILWILKTLLKKNPLQGFLQGVCGACNSAEVRTIAGRIGYLVLQKA